MDKYILRLKDGYSHGNLEIEGLVDVPMNDGRYVWLTKSISTDNVYSYNMSKDKSYIINEKELGELPYKFIKIHDIISVEKEFYNIVCPYTLKKLVYNKEYDKNMWVHVDYHNISCIDRFDIDKIEKDYSKCKNIIVQA